MSNKKDLKRCSAGFFGRIRGIILLTIGLALHGISSAQTYAPLRYWTFDGANALTDSMGNFNMNPNYYGSPYTISTNSSGVGVGKFLTLDGNSTLIQLGQLATDSAFTIEFLLKPGYLFSDSRIFTRVDGSMEARMGYPYIIFTTKINLTSGGTSTDDMQVDLNLIGRRSYGYYVDGNWHHIVFRYNSKTGLKQIWVDGQCPAGFYKTTATGSIANTSTTGKDLLLNTQSSYVKYHGGYDEMALYQYWLPDNMIYKHYTEFLQGKHYSFSWTTTAPPTPSSITGTIDINEYAPGHPSVTVTATDQLLGYPTPRYKTGHTLLPNIPLYGVEQLGGQMQTGVTYTQALNEAKIQQSDLIRNFNQALQITSNSHEYPYYGDTTKFAGYFLKLANNNPTWSTCINTFWPQVTPTLAGYASSQPYITCNCNSSNHYLRNSSGQFLDSYGNVTTSSKTFSPEAPTDSLIKDGMTQRFYLNQLLSRLTRPLNLIFENGEVIPFINNSTTLSKDPTVAAAQAASGLDWYTYEGRKAKEKVLAYRNQFMSLSGLANTKFAYYQVDGQPTWRFKYTEMRQASSLINGQYYPTGDIYMRYPDNWRYWSSAWHGWQWVVESRKVELAAGDKLYSPPVAAGWDINEENNVRPAQWLGMLKAFSMTGAEFFYPSFFGLSSPYPPAKNWVWQVVMPAYAQGITSRYEDFLRNGYLMEGDVPNNPTNPQWNAYSFKSGDFRKLVVVRKHDTINKYAITGTLQPNSNLMGNAENEGTAAINLDGQTVKFKVRRQGSTYIYDKSVASEPVFYQLDSWHEASHPSYWSKDFTFEAELYDNTNSQVSIKTSVPAGTAAGDFTNYTSYISFATASDVVYNFVARKNAPVKYHFWIRARSVDGTATGVNVSLNGANTQKIDCIRDTNWVWYRYDINSSPVAFAGITQQNYMLSISALTNKLQIDKIALIENSGAVYSSVTNTCSAASATITPSGSTSFCQGGSVTLTANSGSAYLWSTGATTQSINVTASGNYTVKVTAAGGTSATSPITTVTVYALPASSISAGSATTFCQGGSVTLTAPAATSYLWSPGNQTTQAISATTAGSYTVRITNSNGCSSTSSATTVTVNALPTSTITAGGTTTFCQGGSVGLTASSGTSYLWSPGNQTTQSITATASGSYTVRVTNSNGCSATSSATTVTVNALPTATTTPSGNISINSGSSATITASAGSAYLWTPGGQTTSAITVNTAGSYSVRVTNSNGCSATSAVVNVSVNSTTPVATITPSGPTSFCQGTTVTLTANTGTAYLWNTGATSQSITTGSSGTYTVTVTASGGGSAVSSPVSITVYALPSATTTAGGATTFCQGGSVTLTSSTGSSYLWTPGNQTTQSISATTSGTYSVRVTNSNGCSATSSGRVVTVNPLPTATTTPSGTVTINSGSSTTLTASSGSSYLWSPGNQTTQSITVSTAGTYSVRVTNSYGCSATSAAVNVTVSTTTTCPPPTSLVTVNVTRNSAELSWQNPGTSVTEFNVRLRNMTTGYYYTTGNVPSTTTSITVGANSSTTYRWWVRSWCGSTRSSYAGYLTFTTPAQRIDGSEISETTSNEPLFEDQEPGEDENTIVLEMDQVNLYPNPASSVSTLSYYTPNDSKFILSITDLTGKVIFRETIEAAEGFNLVDLDLSGLSKGVYMVRLSGDSQNVNKRLSVQ